MAQGNGDGGRTEPDERGIALSELAASLAGATGVVEVLQRVVDAGVQVVRGADLVSVTLRETDGTFSTPVETDALATRLDLLQYRFDEGPCVSAAERERPGVISVPDLDTDTSLGRWSPAAVEHGVHAALAVGVFPLDEPPRSGALNFYSLRRRGIDDADREIAIMVAAHAGAALAATRAVTAAEMESAQLREAIRTRDVIGQAKGILMERQGIGADEAFAILRSASQRLNVKLAEIAGTLVARRGEL
ncbi:GAF and ANTAR domain-containing protein [Pseudonocardia ailaonensis]|uniref:GAF and ANTAR domain-containing protein n=1 Tax=Pseudonocardia ailaonensis TaxID=367279 RepID=A0ABN2NMR3_9PSEU